MVKIGQKVVNVVFECPLKGNLTDICKPVSKLHSMHIFFSFKWYKFLLMREIIPFQHVVSLENKHLRCGFFFFRKKTWSDLAGSPYWESKASTVTNDRSRPYPPQPRVAAVARSHE